MRRILVSKEIILEILNIKERQLNSLIKSEIIQKIETRYNLIPSIRNYMNYKGSCISSIVTNEVDSIFLSGILGISERTVRELAQKGILFKSEKGIYLKDESIKGYIEYLEKKLDKNGQSREEELKKKVADRQLKEMKLHQEAGQLHRTEVVEKCINEIILTFRAAALAIPSKLASRLTNESDTKKVEEILKKSMTDLLNNLSEWRLEDDS